MSDELQVLVSRKQELLKEQAAVAKQFHNLLTMKDSNTQMTGSHDSDGALEDSRKNMKNLEAAIVRAKQPGYFSYHPTSKAVTEMEGKNEFKKLSAKISRLGREIDQVNAEMDKLERKRKQDLQNGLDNPPPISGLKDWFAKYGSPSDTTSNTTGLKTEFLSNPKVYGGTKHHQAFRTVAVTCKRGTLTN